jgi:glycosyltransferase involved in cell wall biosynthesis
MRPVLFLAPYFAPQAAVGAYRSVKLARHLPNEGFRPIVLTGTFAEDARDEALLGALPPAVEVHDRYVDPRLARARRALAQRTARRTTPTKTTPTKTTPMRGMDPFHATMDRYALHALHADRVAAELSRRHPVALVYASLGPWSAAEVALRAARRARVPLVLDLRDPWSLHETGDDIDREGLALRARAALVRRLEERWLRAADHVVLNTDRALDAYRARYPFLAAKSTRIRNHFDIGLYEPERASAEREPERLRILHFGTMRADAPLDDLARALRRLVDRERLRPSDVELVQVGRVGDYERALVKELSLESFVRFEAPVPQAEALRVLRSAHLLALLATPSVRLRIPAKTYDYAAAGMPVLAIADNPELDPLVLGHPASARVLPGDVEAVTSALARSLDAFRRTKRLPAPVAAPIELSAERAASDLASIFRQVLRLEMEEGFTGRRREGDTQT